MKIIIGPLSEDGRRDVFWQRSFVENDRGEILCKLIVCASQEFLSITLKQEMLAIHVDDNMKKWFMDRTEQLYEKAKLHEDLLELEALFDIYPKIDGMLQFAQSVK